MQKEIRHLPKPLACSRLLERPLVESTRSLSLSLSLPLRLPLRPSASPSLHPSLTSSLTLAVHTTSMFFYPPSQRQEKPGFSEERRNDSIVIVRAKKEVIRDVARCQGCHHEITSHIVRASELQLSRINYDQLLKARNVKWNCTSLGTLFLRRRLRFHIWALQ